MKTRLAVTIVVLVAIAFVITSGWRSRVTKHPALTGSQGALPVNQNESVTSNAPEAPSAPLKQKAADETAPVKAPPVVEQFVSWAERTVNESGGRLSEAKVVEGEALAKARQEALYELIKAAPQKALEFAVPSNLRQQLPEEITRHFEERVSGLGDYQVVIRDDFSQPGSPKSTYLRQMTVNGTSYEAFVYGEWLGQGSRPKVLFNGIAVGNRLALHSQGIRRFKIDEVPPLGAERQLCPVSASPADVNGTPDYVLVGDKVESFCGPAHLNASLGILASGGAGGGDPVPLTPISPEWSQGTKKLLYIRVTFTDSTTSPATDQEVRNTVNVVSNWYREASYGTTEITTTITPVIALPNVKSHYASLGDYGFLISVIQPTFEQSGYRVSDHDLFLVRSVDIYPGNAAGFAGLGIAGAWVGSSDPGVHIHELGHNYGLHHANRWAAIGSIIGRGRSQEYGDDFDQMGVPGHLPHFNAPHKYLLNWLPDAFAPRVVSSGVYRIYALDVPALAPGKAYSLRVQKDSARDYWIEVRQPMSSTYPFTKLANDNGVYLHWNPYIGSAQSQMLDMDPDYADPTSNTALQIGRTFSDPIQGVHITPIAQGNDSGHRWVDVAVNLGHFPNNHPPSVALEYHVDPVNTDEHFFSIVPSVANGPVDPDGDTLAYYWDYGQAIDPLSAFPVFQPNSSQVEHPFTGLPQVVRCVVSDMKGGVATVQQLMSSANHPYIQGRITVGGAPLEGVFVSVPQDPHPASVSGGRDFFRHYGYTDSAGYYFITGVDPNNITLTASKNGYAFTQQNGSGGAINFAATENLSRVSITVAPGQVDEDLGESAYVTVSRTGPTDQSVSVAYLLSGTARADLDYNRPSIVIPAGASSATIPITPIEDILDEGSETVTIWLNEAVPQIGGQYTLAQPVAATITITERAVPVITVSAGASSVWETEAVSVLTVSRSGDTASALSVLFSLGGTATFGGDYEVRVGGVAMTTQSFTVTIPAGSASTTFEVRPINDTLLEPDEGVEVNLSSSLAYRRGSGRISTVQILDDEQSNIGIASQDGQLLEAPADMERITVTRTGTAAGLQNPVTLYFRVRALATATLGQDFEVLANPSPGVTGEYFVTIPANQLSAEFHVRGLDDSWSEGNESFTLELVKKPNYRIGVPAFAQIVVTPDNDPTQTQFWMTSSATTVKEGGIEYIVLHRQGGPSSSLPITVHYDGSATLEVDFGIYVNGNRISEDGAPFNLFFLANMTNVLFEIRCHTDEIADNRETVELQFSGASAIVEIIDAQVTVAAQDAVAGESPPNPGSFTVTRTGPFHSALEVNYTLGGTAVNGQDYAQLSGTVIIPANSASATVTVTPTDDAHFEGSEPATLQIGASAQYIIGTASQATVTISDNDPPPSITIASSTLVIREAGSASIGLLRSGNLNGALTVQVGLSGDASSSVDYQVLVDGSPVTVSGSQFSVILPANQSSGQLVVQSLDDSTSEHRETITFTVLADPLYVMGGASSHTINVLDNEATIVAGHHHSLCIRPDMNGRLWAWGNNQYGQLGDSTTVNRLFFVTVTGVSNMVAVSAATAHSLGVKSDGTVWAWGNNSYGRLGDGTTTARSIPVQLTGISDVVDIAAGTLHSIALKSDGTVWVWGDNSEGQLGNGTMGGTQLVPVQVGGLNNVVSVSAGAYHNVALKADGTLVAWGANAGGQLGDNTNLRRFVPVAVQGLNNVRSIAVRNEKSHAVKYDDTAWSWGRNSSGMLGDGTQVDRFVAVPMSGGTNVRAIAAGYFHTVVLRNDGAVLACGSNSAGQLGDGTTTTRTTLVPCNGLVLNPAYPSSIAAGFSHSLASRYNMGNMLSWGNNAYGQLGIGSQVNQLLPVEVWD